MLRIPVVNLKKLFTSDFLKCRSSVHSNWNYKSTAACDERVVITDDGSTIVCWHPPKKFPYECSKPIPKVEVKPENTILKVENKAEIYNVFKTQNETFVREELMKLTHTTKHRWFPKNSRYRKTFKKAVNHDREWL